MTKNSLNACPKCGGPADNGLPWYLNTIRSLETQLAEARVNSTPDTSPAVFLKAWDAIVNTKQAPEGTYAWAKWGWETAIKAIAQPTPDLESLINKLAYELDLHCNVMPSSIMEQIVRDHFGGTQTTPDSSLVEKLEKAAVEMMIGCAFLVRAIALQDAIAIFRQHYGSGAVQSAEEAQHGAASAATGMNPSQQGAECIAGSAPANPSGYPSELPIEQLICMADDCRSLIDAGLQRDALFSIGALKELLIKLQRREYSVMGEAAQAPLCTNDGLPSGRNLGRNQADANRASPAPSEISLENCIAAYEDVMDLRYESDDQEIRTKVKAVLNAAGVKYAED